MQRYFISENYQVKPIYQLTDENYHHIVRVMRMQPGEKMYVVFQDQVAIQAEIKEITAESVVVSELEKEVNPKELPIAITIACGYPKGDKLDLVVQKGTELGAHAFIGFPAKTSVVKWDEKKLAKKALRLTKIAQEAAEQSHRVLAPSIDLLPSFQQLVKQFEQFDEVLIAYEESAKQGEQARLAQVFERMAKGQRLLIVFGPEGGFHPDEIAAFQQGGASLCGLGPRILRAETAPLYCLAAASFAWELQK